mmetsp:Transcript_9613/g.29112  ORF Transcript_9613/g.29112 Transcript_9613/m.29112 type:complete len:194 (+) Transcript_9613:3050-3631(+)
MKLSRLNRRTSRSCPDAGAETPVTANNRLEYIYRVANYRLNVQIKAQTAAFLSGMADVVDLDLIQMFSPKELQLMIQGKAGIDLADLRRNTFYRGGYTEESPVIQWFWDVADDMDDETREKLLRFITSSPRAPLLGFKNLHPKFAIHVAEGDERLPTASTCVNLLKLPMYKSKQILQEKLLYSINANAGFDLS